MAQEYATWVEQYLPHTGPRHVLLVWPCYYSTYPPLGLLKIGAYHRKRGDIVDLCRPPHFPNWTPDAILVTSLFTYSWREVCDAVIFYKHLYPAAPVLLGGIYASLMPDHARKHIPGLTDIFVGTAKDLDTTPPDYSLLSSLMPNWNKSLVFSSRGCVRACQFCAVPILEPTFSALPSIANLICRTHTQIVLWDNNFLASPYAQDILCELREIRNQQGKRFLIDFNQGLDARLLTPSLAKSIAMLNLSVVRLSYDREEYRKAVENAIVLLETAGVPRKKMVVYVLYNYTDTPEDFLRRIQDLMEWRVTAYPMRYQPLDTTEKDVYVGQHWTPELLEMVADARRVLGINGAWPPHDGLRKKFCSATDIREALRLSSSVRSVGAEQLSLF